MKNHFEKVPLNRSIFSLCTAALFLAGFSQAITGLEDRYKVAEELTAAEKKEMIQDLIEEGDRHFGAKDYNRAAGAYESVFLLEPEHGGASGRIDQLKKRMLKEGKSETEVLGQVYDSEIEARTRFYLGRARELLGEGKTGQARLELEKLLLLNPLHEEGRKLYETLQAEFAEESP